MFRVLDDFWAEQGCVVLSPYDGQVGAGTFHWATALRALGPQDWRAAYAQPSRRPGDGRYGTHPNRLGSYYQYQVILKPSPLDGQRLYLESLRKLGIDLQDNDVRFIEDDWKSPTLAAAGLGWEVWLNGMEVSQFTYFQQVGEVACRPVCTEITYGMERLAMAAMGVENVYDLVYSKPAGGRSYSYGDVFQAAESEYSTYHFEHANSQLLFEEFAKAETEAGRLADLGLLLPAYDQCLRASHVFNQLDACGAISVGDRQAHIFRVAALVKKVATQWDARAAARHTPHVAAPPATLPDIAPTLSVASGGKGEVLIEICSAELPPTMQGDSADAFGKLLHKLLEDAGFSAAKDEVQLTTFATKHRLAVVLSGVWLQTPQRTEEVRGPAVTAPDQAIQGFLQRVGLQSIDECGRVAGKKAEHFVATVTVGGENLLTALGGILNKAASSMRWARSMRFADEELVWPRPIEAVNVLVRDNFGKLIPVPGALAVGGTRQQILFTTTTRTLGVEGTYTLELMASSVPDLASHYAQTLRGAGIEPEPQLRMERVQQQLRAQGIEILEDEALLREVAGLAEAPTIVIGEFDRAYLELPSSLLHSCMRTHQRYFALPNVNRFVAVAEGASAPGAAPPRAAADTMRQGFERVLNARLADAQFFIDEDKKNILTNRKGVLLPSDATIKALKAMRFNDAVGSLHAYGLGLMDMGEKVANDVVHHEAAVEASMFLIVMEETLLIAKTDLVSQTVGEFPELQGEVGSFLYKNMREVAHQSKNVLANAITAQYQPKGEAGELPSTLEGTFVALIEHSAYLTTMWASGARATSSGDKFGLRRRAIALIRLLAEANPQTAQLLERAKGEFSQGSGQHSGGIRFNMNSILYWLELAGAAFKLSNEVIFECGEFIRERLISHAVSKGIKPAYLQGLLPRVGREFGVPRIDVAFAPSEFIRQAQELQNVLETEAGQRLLQLYRRANNIVFPPSELQSQKLLTVYEDIGHSENFDTEEQQFLDTIAQQNQKGLIALDDNVITTLEAALQKFFELHINHEDETIRKRRLECLKTFLSFLLEFADFNAIERALR